MGLFGFIGKAIGGIAKAVGGAAKVAAPFLPGPIGSIARVAGSVLQVKHGASPKIVTGGHPTVMRGRGNVGRPGYGAFRTPNGYRPPPNILRSSPVMPGGAIAAPSGMTPQVGTPPLAYGGGTAPLLLRQQPAGWAINRGGGAKKRRKSSSHSPKKRRTSGGRKLKFGSPAWRKKYMRAGRRKKRRAA